MQGIYCIEHIATGRKYYGSSINIDRRLSGHKRQLLKGTHHNLLLQRAVTKYGISEFSFHIIEELPLLTRKELLEREQWFLDNNLNGYNLAPAQGGDILSSHPNKQEIRNRIRNSHSITMSNLSVTERKARYSKPGKRNGNYKDGLSGKKPCPQCGKLIAKAYKKCSKCQNKTGINNPFFNKHHSEETKQKLREAMSGDNSWIKGISPEKLSYTNKYKITYPNGDVKIVFGLKEISKEFDVSIANIHATIARMAMGKLPSKSVFKGHLIEKMSK